MFVQFTVSLSLSILLIFHGVVEPTTAATPQVRLNTIPIQAQSILGCNIANSITREFSTQNVRCSAEDQEHLVWPLLLQMASLESLVVGIIVVVSITWTIGQCRLEGWSHRNGPGLFRPSSSASSSSVTGTIWLGISVSL